MPSQIIKQPNGLYAIFSTVVDDFTWYNLTRAAVIQNRLDEGRPLSYVTEILNALDKGEKPHTLALTWDEALNTVRTCHGQAKLDEFLQQCGMLVETQKKE